MPRCSQCGEERAKSEYSSSQVKLKPHARRCKLCVSAGIPVADPQPRSISSAFLTAAELPTGLADDKYLRLARVYMDHDFPVTMSDGSPKQIPEAALRCADAAELRQTFGYGSGGFFGEVLFWKRWRGVLLGKQKWSCHSDTPEGDTAPMSELWDMRWVFPSRELARAFHADMVGASREEGGRGYLDGPDDPDDAAFRCPARGRGSRGSCTTCSSSRPFLSSIEWLRSCMSRAASARATREAGTSAPRPLISFGSCARPPPRSRAGSRGIVRGVVRR